MLFTGPVTEQKRGQKGEPVKPKFLGSDPLVEPELPVDVKDPRNFPERETASGPAFFEEKCTRRLDHERGQPVLRPCRGETESGAN